jgi:membrane-associated protease RseP (regulator of RpoE activity)
MASKIRIVAALGFTLIVSGCANGYSKFYQSSSPPPPSATQFLPYEGEPRIVASGGDAAADSMRMFEDGYGLVGVSSFVGPPENQKGAIEQAKKVGAAVIIFRSKYQSTVSGSIPITTPTTQTSYTSGTVNAYGGTGTYSGTTTTYGTQTTDIPYSVDRYDQAAYYFKPLERKGLGISVMPLPVEQRQKLGTNKGVVIRAIRKGSPAFAADILPGDIVLSVNERAVFDVPSALDALTAARGSTANLLMVRNGNQFSKSVAVPAGEW